MSLKINKNLLKMKNKFETFGNGNNSITCWANPKTKEIYPANRNSFGYNALVNRDDNFFEKYGKNMKTNAPKSMYGKSYSWSEKQMTSIGFQLVKRGESPLW